MVLPTEKEANLKRKERFFTMKLTKEYLVLFNAITDAEESLRILRERLMAAQQKAEELYISHMDEDVFPPR